MKKLIFLIYFLTASVFSFGQGDVEFCYELTPDVDNDSLLHVQARIVNSTNQKFYFLSESCNDLEYYLQTGSEDVEVFVRMHCNISYPVKKFIEAKSQYTFKSMLKVKNNSNNFELNLNLVQLDATTNVEEKIISALHNEYDFQTWQLKGQLLKPPYTTEHNK